MRTPALFLLSGIQLLPPQWFYFFI
ncbi:hypothetical protein CBM2606_A180053 [Cupriavidus taiwanensis]|nr:hypothetical protein CBM2606_A180053 [Cupriavidus taiwanensis]